jgi:hypothetical protein
MKVRVWLVLAGAVLLAAVLHSLQDRPAASPPRFLAAAELRSPAQVALDAWHAAVRANDTLRMRQLADSIAIQFPGTDAALQTATATTAAQAAAAQARAETQAEALAALRMIADEVDGVVAYVDSGAPRYLNSRNWFGLTLFGRRGEPLAPFLRIDYVADEWIFVDRYAILADGQRFELVPDNFGPSAVQRDNGGGKVWETWATPAIPHLAMLRMIAGAKRVVLRYGGQRKYDRTITAREKAGIRQVLAAYDALH